MLESDQRKRFELLLSNVFDAEEKVSEVGDKANEVKQIEEVPLIFEVLYPLCL